ncbi:MAG: hypothetical protein OXG43_03020 [Chloroflexi bacterium]|nr:hypothetical protein [Chloroflexota bacterium]
MDRPVRVAVVGEGPVARRYASAVATVADVQLVELAKAQALVVAESAALPEPAATGLPLLFDPDALVSLGATPESRAALRALPMPALAALPWRSAPVVRLARRLLAAPKFVHAHITTQGVDSLPAAGFHTLDILTHLMGRSPNRVYAESGPGTSSDPAAPSTVAGTLEFGPHGSAAFAVSRLDGPADSLSAVVQLTDGRRTAMLSGGFTTAALAGFNDAEIATADTAHAFRAVGNSQVVTVDWRPADGVADSVRDLVQTVRTGQAPPEAPNLSGALRTAALVRAALATAGSGRPRQLVVR